MDFGLDAEILDDFLIEAGEILDLLSEQLIQLEQAPNDADLLNSIFRGFHTVKGGSGFLSLTPMVDCCHGAENIFDVLRNHKRTLTPELMDIILLALDAVKNMFEELQMGNSELAPVSEELISQLHKFSKPETEDESYNLHVVDITEEAAFNQHCSSEDSGLDNVGIDNLSNHKFQLLLDSIDNNTNTQDLITSELNQFDVDVDVDAEITDEEFERLLDELHGKGNGPVIQQSTLVTAAIKQPQVIATQKKHETTVRVETSTLDDIMNMVGELVLVRNRLLALSSSNSSNNEEMSKTIASLDIVTADLQSGVMRTRMQPIKKVFGKFPRVVRDLARTLDKKIELTLVGEDTDLDKNLVEALADPLVHLVRNSVDHGIEMPSDRLAKGKPETGVIILSASQEGDHILLSIQDDGAGMDPEKLKNIAINRGILDEESAARMTDENAYQLIFEPGFSTKTEISDISGRGVGMDVVKTSLIKLSGTITVKSELGKGSIIEIKVPLTLAILPALMIGVLSNKFALPLTNVKEIINIQSKEISIVGGFHTIYVRNKPIQLFYLEDWLCKSTANMNSDKSRHVIITHCGNETFGFVVSNLVGQEEVVIKPLDNLLKGTPGMAGATITSDGGIALIIDIPALVKHYIGN